MAIDITSTALRDDPDPRGTDKYGFLPLIVELPDDDREEEMGAGEEDGDRGGEPALVEPSSIVVDVRPGTELPDDDDAAYQALTSATASDLSPGEAEDLIEYMRPLTPDEAELTRDPFLKDLWWVDDPAHIDDVLRAGKNDRGIDNYLRDGTYGEDPMNDDERAERKDTDNLRGWGGERLPPSLANGLRRRRRRHHHRRYQGQGQGQGQLAYGSPGNPVPGTFVPGQAPAFQAPADAAYAAAHSSAAPALAPAPAPYLQPYGQPYQAPYQQSYQQPYQQPYQPPYGLPAATTATPPSTYVPTYLVGRAVSTAVRQGLIDKMVVEHANWLADMDKRAKVPVRPRAYYEHAAKLWTIDKLKKSAVTASGGASRSHDVGLAVRSATQLLRTTRGQRQRFSSALGLDDSLGGWGWNPLSAAKSAVKSVSRAATSTVKRVGKTAYKYGKKGITAPIKYTYKGVKYVGKMAQDLALRPIRAVINKFTGTMVSRRANLLAQQRGQKIPTAADKSAAKNWAKSFVRTKGGKFGGAIASLMGGDPEYGIRNVDISMSGTDVMGLGTSGVAGLILLGPIGLVALLTGLVKLSGSAAPAPAPGSEEAAAEAEQAAAAEQAAMDDGSADPGADPGTDPGAYEDPGAYDSQEGWGRQNRRVTIEDLNRMSPSGRARAQRMIRAGRLQLG